MTKRVPKWIIFGIGIATALLAGIYGKEIGSGVSKYIGITKKQL